MQDGEPGADADALIFTRPEDEFLHKHCAWHFVFPIDGRPVGKDGLQPSRLVMAVDMAKVPAARKELDEVVGNMAEDPAAMAAAMAAAAAAAGAGKGAAQFKAKATRL